MKIDRSFLPSQSDKRIFSGQRPRSGAALNTLLLQLERKLFALNISAPDKTLTSHPQKNHHRLRITATMAAEAQKDLMSCLEMLVAYETEYAQEAALEA